MLKRIIEKTKEGTYTIVIPELGESYHSKNGVLQEAQHVFINNGFKLIKNTCISILEIGFGTGLNAFVTLFENIQKQKEINYYAIEKYPVTGEELALLEYWKWVNCNSYESSKSIFLNLHQENWGNKEVITNNFNLYKYKDDFFNLEKLPIKNIDLVYFDAFGARIQPELWGISIFKQIYEIMNKGGLLTTYSSKGSARRALQEVGFHVEKKIGSEGKREMMNAWKL